jgi:hypothetical protein
MPRSTHVDTVSEGKHVGTPGITLREFRTAAATDIRRWIEELDRTPPRGTLSVGIFQQACRYAEELLRRAAESHIEGTPDLGAEALSTVSGGKKKHVAKLTLGECVQLLLILDSKRRLGSKRKVISKSDRTLLDRLSGSRNRFAHGSASARLEREAMGLFLADVLRLSEAAVIEEAVLRETR